MSLSFTLFLSLLLFLTSFFSYHVSPPADLYTLSLHDALPISYPSLPDQDAQIMYALRGQVAPNAVPSTLVLDREGRVAARISGALEPSTLRAMIDRVLAERWEEHTSELQSRGHLVCRLLLETKNQ